MMSLVLLDKFQFTNDDIADLMVSIESISDRIEVDATVLDDMAEWSKQQNFYIHFLENQSFMNPETRLVSEFKMGLKTSVIVNMFYVLFHEMNKSADDLLKIKNYLIDLQDSVDKKYTSYQDMYKSHTERGIKF